MLDGAERGVQRVDVNLEGTTRAVRLTIDEAYAGGIRNDTYIAEIAVNFTRGEAPASYGRLDTWKASAAAERAAEAHREEVIAQYDLVDQADFGDRDAMAELMGWASNGAPWLADRVRREVPVGFRIGALPPDEVAVEALLKLKDANAIPALRMAALRLLGRAERTLLAKVDYFQAFTQLASGPRRSLATWGENGWEKGALQGLGEPMTLQVGVYGDLYVSDVANNRISIFAQDGTTRALWGMGQPEVTNTWFSGKRGYYVTGKSPSTKAGGFTNPIDLVLVPQRDGDEVIVLDSMGRVQWFDGNGAVLKSWKVRAETPISPGVGGEGHLLLVKGKVVVVWGNELLVFDAEGEQLERWQIEDGVPITAEALKNGKIILGFARQGVMYSLDGFRHGEVISDELPMGFESWDLASDEKGKLWIVTDNGWALKLKRPGKIDFQVRWNDYSADVPRFDVIDGMLYVVANDQIYKVDAYEAKAKADLAAAEAEAE